MICISLIGMTPGIVCRNFFPFLNFPFIPDDFQKFAEEHILLNSRVFELTPDTSELIYLMKKKTQGNMLCWVGRYVYAPEPVLGRQGGYIGAGVWTLDVVVDPSASLELLRHLCLRVKRLMSLREQSGQDFAKLVWEETKVDETLLQAARTSMEKLEWSDPAQSLGTGAACYIDASSDEQSYDMVALLNFAQTAEDFRDYDRIYLTNSARTALAEGKTASVKVIKVSDLPENVRNTLVMEDIEAAAPHMPAERSVSEASAESQLHQRASAGPSKQDKIAWTEPTANGVENALKNRVLALESKHRSLHESVKLKWEYQKLLQMIIAAAAAISLVSIVVSSFALAISLNAGPAPDMHDRGSAMAKTPPPANDPVAASPALETPEAYVGASYVKQKDRIVDNLKANLRSVAELESLLQSPECQRFFPIGNGVSDTHLPGAVACYRKIGSASERLRTLNDALTETVKTLP